MNIDNKIKKNIASNIAFYRKKNNITQKELASLLNAKSTTISTWERASSLPDAETIFSLCKIFRITLADLYGCDSFDDTASFSINSIEKEIITAYRNSDDITKELVHRSLGINPLNTENKVGKIS